MDGNTYWKPNEQGGDSHVNNANGWKSHQDPDLRKKVLTKIVENLKRYFPNRTQNEITSCALKFEDKAYGMSKDKDHYLRTIADSVRNFERKVRNLQSNNVQSGSSVNATNTPDPASQVLNQRQSLQASLPYTETPTSQKWFPQNNQSNLNIPESFGLSTQVPMTTSMAQNVNIQMDERVHPNLLPGSQRPIQGRSQQFLPQPQEQPQKSNYIGNLRLRHLEKPQKPQQQHHQKSLLEQPTQQSFPQSSLPSSGQQNSQFLPRHEFPTQRVHSNNQQQMAVMSQEQKQQEQERLITQLMNGPDTQQQNHLTTRRNNNGEQQGAFRNNNASFQAMAQQNNNLPNMHQERLRSHEHNASALPSQQQQNIHAGQSGNFNVRGTSLFGTQGQGEGQPQPSRLQEYQQQHPLQQPQNRVQQNVDSVHKYTHRFQAPGFLRETQNIADQPNQPYQLQRAPSANPSTSQDSLGKTVNATGGDWQEETYQKIKALKDMYLPVLSTMHRKVVEKLRQIDSFPPQTTLYESTEKLRVAKSTLELVIVYLNVHRSGLSEKHRDRFSIYEGHVLKLTKNLPGPWRPMQQQQQQQQGIFPPSQNHQVHVSQSLDKNQMNSQLMPQGNQNGALCSVSGLTTSQTATHHSLQTTRPMMEPKDESHNTMTSLSNPQGVHSSISSVQSCLFQQQQKQLHHPKMQQQKLQEQPLPHQQANQQLQMSTSHQINENNDSRLRQQHFSPQPQVPKPLAASPAQKSNFSPSDSYPQIHHNSAPQFIDQKILPVEIGAQEHSLFTLPSHEPIVNRPIDRLINAVQSSSPKYLAESVNDMSSVISIADRIAGSFHSGVGSRAGLGEDLSANFLLQEENLLTHEETNPGKRLKRSIITRPLDIVASQTDIYNKQFSSLESEVDSTASSDSKDNKIEQPGCALLREINEINGRLVETKVDISNVDAYLSEVASGIIVSCSYAPVTLSDTFKAHYMSGHVTQIQPLRLLVPASYPYSSPILVENIPLDDPSVHSYEDLSARTRSRFSLSMNGLTEPKSLKDIVQMWNDCARVTMTEYAERYGGGTFSSKYGTWETVPSSSYFAPR